MSVQIAPKHDFASKLRQPGALPVVVEYVEWQKRVRAAQQAGAPAPALPKLPLLSLNLDLTTACNFQCTHCIDYDKLNTGIRYDDSALRDSLQVLVDEGLKSVILIGGGEPTIHPRFAEVVLFLKERHLAVGIVTNGSRGDVLLEVAPLLGQGDWIRLSLDAGTDETFRAMHLPRHKRLTLESICAWVPQIRARNSQVQVGFSFIITWQGSQRNPDARVIANLSEMAAAAQLARHYRFNYISYKPFLTRFADGAEVVDQSVLDDRDATVRAIAEGLRQARALETEEFKVLESTNLRVLMGGSWREFLRQPKTCHVLALRQVLSPLGVYHCPGKRGAQSARIGEKDAYTAKRRAETRAATAAMLEQFDASVECAEVTCLYNPTNHWLEGLIAGDVSSVELEPLAERGDYYL